jgi:rSAM/selenodomain-associated transferase 2
MLSIVIPTLNAADTLGATLAALDDGGARGGHIPALETIVADGGSTDGTRPMAEGLGAQVVVSARGRGRQMIAGAEAAEGDWLMFLHADTRLAPGWSAAAAAFMADPANGERAGYFRFALDDRAPAARRVERLVAWRCRRLGLPYGDQGLLIARPFYEALGGYRPLVMMEDVALVRRIGRRRLVALDATALTSARRYERDGYVARPARNLLCLALYFLGLPPRLIARLYA